MKYSPSVCSSRAYTHESLDYKMAANQDYCGEKEPQVGSQTGIPRA